MRLFPKLACPHSLRFELDILLMGRRTCCRYGHMSSVSLTYQPLQLVDSRVSPHVLATVLQYARTHPPEECQALADRWKADKLTCSHLCRNGSCHNPRHLVPEPLSINRSRSGCQAQVPCLYCSAELSLCSHDPPCIRRPA